MNQTISRDPGLGFQKPKIRFYAMAFGLVISTAEKLKGTKCRVGKAADPLASAPRSIVGLHHNFVGRFVAGKVKGGNGNQRIEEKKREGKGT